MSRIIYYIKGTVYGTKVFMDYEDTLHSVELLEYFDDIKQLFKQDEYAELAQYLPDDHPLHEVVKEIWVDVKVIKGDLYSWTKVVASRELSEREQECLLDYLTGQFSDGYGEGLEQQEFISLRETETYEEYDEELDEYYEDEYEVYASCYLHLWSSNNFRLEFAEKCEEECVDALLKPKCKLIGEDGNIFNLIGIASKALTNAGLKDKATQMASRVVHSASYSEALSIIMEYVEVM